MSRVLGVLALGLWVAACTREPRPSEPVAADTAAKSMAASAAKNTVATLAADGGSLETVCTDVVPESVAPEWIAGPLVSSGSAAQADFSAPVGAWGLLALQNGDGLGQGTAPSAEALLDGQVVATAGTGEGLKAVPVWLGGGNQLQVRTTGGGTARASVALLTKLPCSLLDVQVERGRGPAPRVTRAFQAAGPQSLGVLVVEAVGGQVVVGQVVLNGQVVLSLAQLEHLARPQVLAVPLQESNTLKVELMSGAGASVRVRVVDVDSLAPQVDLTAPVNGAVVAASPLQVSGTAGLDATVVEVNGTLATLSSGALSASVPLTAGSQALVATARDACGNVRRVCRAVVLDAELPVVTVSGVTEGQYIKAPVVLTYSVEDAHPGTVEATLDGQPFTSGSAVTTEGPHLLVVKAVDQAGNTKEVQRTFTVDSVPPALTVQSPVSGLLTRELQVEVVVSVEEAGQVARVLVGGEDLVKGVDGLWRRTVSLAEGANQLVVSALDAAGNPASVTRSVVRDSTAPILVISSPSEGARVSTLTVKVRGTATDTTPVVLTVNGASVTVASDGAFEVQQTLVQGSNTLELLLTDAAGNATPRTLHVFANETKPTLSITEPTDGLVTEATAVTVRGTATPHDSADTLTVMVAGALAATSADGSFVRTVQLSPGEQSIQVVAMDSYGLRAESTVRVTRKVTLPDGGTVDAGTPQDGGSGGVDGGTGPSTDAGTGVSDAGTGTAAPVLVLNAPAQGAVLGGSSVAVLGEVQGGTLPLSVKVNGASATVSVRSFSMSLSLPEGEHSLTVVVTDADGRTASTTRDVSVDRTKPYLNVTRPTQSPVTVSEVPYTLEGEVADDHLAGVTVQGIPVQVLAGHFSASVPLAQGETVVEVVATDAAGNREHRSVVLKVDSAPPQVTVLEPLSGSEASASTVHVRARVMAFAALEEVRIGTGVAAEESPGVYAADVALALGENTLVVTAKDVKGLTGRASVVVRYRSPTTEPLVVTGVQPAQGAMDVKTDALISVSFNKATTLESVRQGFEVLHRGKPLAGGYSLAPGGQTATFIAAAPLPEGELLQVRVEDLEAVVGPGQGADFVSELTVRRPLTRVRGYVMDDAFQPLPGVRVVLEGTTESVRTGADGNWSMIAPVTGPRVFRFEGGSTADGQPLPVVRRQVTIVPEAETADVPLVLTAVDTASATRVDTTTALHVDFQNRHGALALDGDPESLLFDDGQMLGTLTATRLEPVAVPVKLESSASPTALWQVGPSGVRVQKPLLLQFPNVTGLPPGRYVVVLAHEPRNHTLARVGLAKVSPDGMSIRTDAPLALRSVELVGYMSLSQEQDAVVRLALGETGGQGSSANDAGTEGALPPWLRMSPSWMPRWKQALDAFFVSEAHAQGLVLPWVTLDTFNQQRSLATVTGIVHAPQDRQITLSPSEALKAYIAVPREVTLPFRLPVSLRVERTTVGTDDELLAAFISAKSQDGLDIPAPDGESWSASTQRVDEDELVLSGNVPLDRGTTTVTLGGRKGSTLQTYILKVQAVPVTGSDAGPDAYRLVFSTDQGASTGTVELQSVVRFPNQRVTVTGPGPTMSTITGSTGTFGIPLNPPSDDEMGIACAEIPLGSRPIIGKDPETGAAFVQSMVTASYPTCSPTFHVSSGQQVRADILVDARLLHGALHFVDREGHALRRDCSAGGGSQFDADAGTFSTISNTDILRTEVHFFRADDLERPIAQFTVGAPDEKCEQPEPGRNVSQGHYARVRVGPTAPSKRIIRERCRELNPAILQDPSAPAPTNLSDGDRAFYETECRDNRTNFLRLTAGEPLVVVAVNHATGHTGMTRLNVPPIVKKQVDANGRCALDDEKGPMKVEEFGQTALLSRCSVAELGIDAPVYLFPPEIDVRVWRSAEPEGVTQDAPPTLVRHGGAATTRDTYVHVDTHWRVRTMAPAEWRTEDGGVREEPLDLHLPDRVDGGISPCPDPVRDGGVVPSDGGTKCRPDLIRDEGISGRLLETCSEYGAGMASSATKQTACLRAQDLQDVPAGVPPLAGRVVRVTSSAVEQPEVAQFGVVPGRGSAALQAAMRIVTPSGQRVTLGSLTRANYYLHVVGHEVFPRDLDGDGVLRPEEKNAKPPDFSEETGPHPLGLPKRAVGLKNVYASLDPDGFRVLRYDTAREHEFRVLELTDPKVIAQGSVDSRVLDGGSAEADPDDQAYVFLANLLEPEGTRRASTPVGDYVVRFGGDQYGVECDVSILSGGISGTCDNEFIDDVLSANDLLYVELYLSGNAENVLYRFNLMGLSPRVDLLKAGSYFTSERSVETGTDGKPVLDRAVSIPSVARFALDPDVIQRGRVKMCTSEQCAEGTLVKEADVELLGTGRYRVQETDGGIAEAPLEQLEETGLNAARLFVQPVPAPLVSMPGAETAKRFYLVQEIDVPEKRTLVQTLGTPKGTFEGLHARAPGQLTIQGINVADGHLSFEHEDFAVPQLAEVVRFARTYDNQSSLVGPTGVGWMHNYEGFVQEEELGRYTVVVAGQAYDFPVCRPVDEVHRTATDCVTDRSHGMRLRIEQRQTGTVAVVETANGYVYEFSTRARGFSQEERRRWLLDRFHDGHGRDMGEGWTRLTYKPNTNLVETVERTPGMLQLKLTYEPIDTTDETQAYRLRSMARNQGFEKLDKVELRLKSTGVALHTLKFAIDERGNLRNVVRTSALPATQEWAYEYELPPTGLSGHKLWLASNELKQAKLKLSAPDNDDLRFVQWQATYGREAQPGKYPHVEAFEAVTSVVGTGMPDPGWKITSPDPFTRSIHRPDGVTVTLDLNKYGNTRATDIPGLGSSTVAWGSDARGGPVQADLTVSPTGRAFQNTINDRLQLDGVTLKTRPSGSEPVPGAESGPLWSVTSRQEKTGRIQGMSLALGTCDGNPCRSTVSQPLSSAGDLQGLTVTGPANDTVFTMQQSPDPDGVVLAGTAPDGNTMRFYGHENQPLGLPLFADVVLPTPAKGGLQQYTVAYTYDALGNRTSEVNLSTGATVQLTYDAVGRLLSRTVPSTHDAAPEEKWQYTYALVFDGLRVTETVALGRWNRSHSRTVGYDGGLKTFEEYEYGPNNQKARISYDSYSGSRLQSFLDARNHRHTLTYDNAGRVTGETVETTPVYSQALDADGNVTRVTDSRGLSTRIFHDGLGRAVRWEYESKLSDDPCPEPGPCQYADVETVVLNAAGGVVKRSFGSLRTSAVKQHVLESTTDALGRQLRVWSNGSPGGVDSQTFYDGAGRVYHRVDNELGLDETFEYQDALGRVTQYVRTVQSVHGVRKLTETRTYTDSDSGVGTVVVKRTLTGREPVEEGTPEGGATAEDTREETRTYQVDARGHVLSLTETVDGQASLQTWKYDALGREFTHTDPVGRVTTFEYDAAGNLLVVKAPGDVTTGFTTTSFTHDAHGNVLTQVGPRDGESWVMFYDDLERLLSRALGAYGDAPTAHWSYSYPGNGVEQETAPEGVTTTRTYNARGLVEQETRAGKGGALSVRTKYDGTWVKQQTRSEGLSSLKVDRSQAGAIDDRGRPWKEAESWSAPGHSYQYSTQTSWDGREALTTESWSMEGQNLGGRLLTTDVDSLGNVVRKTQNGAVDAWDYYADGKSLWMLPAGYDGEVAATTWNYDTSGRVKTVRFGTELTTHSYYADGLLKSVTTPDTRVRALTYNARGLVETETYGIGSDVSRTTYAAYDQGGRAKAVKWAAGTSAESVWNYEYGPRDELLKETLPDVGTFEYGYDALARLTSVKPPSGSVTQPETYEPDFLGRTLVRRRGTATWSTAWNNGSPEEANGLGEHAEYVLDGRGRVVREVFKPGSEPITDASGAKRFIKDLESVDYVYNGLDQLRRVTESRASNEVVRNFRYDPQDRLQSVEDGTDTVSYGYHTSGAPSFVQAPAGRVEYGVDSLQRLNLVKLKDGRELDVKWEPGGNRLAMVGDAALKETYCYDARGRLKSVTHDARREICDAQPIGAPKLRYSYTYDERDNRLTEVVDRSGASGQEQTEYGYDAADRLTGVRYPDGESVLYALAKDGSRKGEKTATGYLGTLGPDGFAGLADPQNHLTYEYDTEIGGLAAIKKRVKNPQSGETSNVPVAQYQTNKAGRVVSEQRGDFQRLTRFDAAGRLVEVELSTEDGQQRQVKYQYDYAGLRRARAVGDVATKYLWSGNTLVEERLPGTGAVLYQRGAGLVLATGNERILQDGLGSAVGRLSTSGTLTVNRYDAWGGYRDGNTPTSMQPSLGFTGHAFDADVGLTYAQQRWLDTATGRFVSLDPLPGQPMLPMRWNGSIYAMGSPLRYVDPTGEAEDWALEVSSGEAGDMLAENSERLSQRCSQGDQRACNELTAVRVVSGSMLVGITAGVALVSAPTVIVYVGSIGGGAVALESGVDALGVVTAIPGCMIYRDPSACMAGAVSTLDLMAGPNLMGDTAQFGYWTSRKRPQAVSVEVLDANDPRGRDARLVGSNALPAPGSSGTAQASKLHPLEYQTPVATRRLKSNNPEIEELLYPTRRPTGPVLPGRQGIKIKYRPTPDEMERLSTKFGEDGTEFAVTYVWGPGKNGGGGQYYLHSGTNDQVAIPVAKNRMFIYHTHPGTRHLPGNPEPSGPDKDFMDFLANPKLVGSPQRTSTIVPVNQGGILRRFGGRQYEEERDAWLRHQNLCKGVCQCKRNNCE
ncbi:hypothetical protein JY651_14960 [Pyxidicoccus parkwayensis]|uniref:DUF6531 domain-containing protein n=1 Tax=Pyxidicoccus parkwayensis TaxID=2813578 RepID=A0ABX7P6S7_9BACT|nr:RHS repeat-associated core domain-containing protein [Pyxidicoccus parkwaysis]QSQ26146.1 hypothetical protein JY651_14960 [Pyxidicoccus parkwaysis]